MILSLIHAVSWILVGTEKVAARTKTQFFFEFWFRCLFQLCTDTCSAAAETVLAYCGDYRWLIVWPPTDEVLVLFKHLKPSTLLYSTTTTVKWTLRPPIIFQFNICSFTWQVVTTLMCVVYSSFSVTDISKAICPILLILLIKFIMELQLFGRCLEIDCVINMELPLVAREATENNFVWRNGTNFCSVMFIS